MLNQLDEYFSGTQSVAVNGDVLSLSLFLAGYLRLVKVEDDNSFVGICLLVKHSCCTMAPGSRLCRWRSGSLLVKSQFLVFDDCFPSFLLLQNPFFPQKIRMCWLVQCQFLMGYFWWVQSPFLMLEIQILTEISIVPMFVGFNSKVSYMFCLASLFAAKSHHLWVRHHQPPQIPRFWAFGCQDDVDPCQARYRVVVWPGIDEMLGDLLLEIPKKSGLMMVKYWSLSKA